MTSKCKNVCFAMPFSIFATVLSIAMVVTAFLGIVGQNDSAKDTVRKEFCESDSFTVNGQTFQNLDYYMSKMYGSSVDRYVCTAWCPCDEAIEPQYTKAIGDGFEIGVSDNDVKQYRIASLASIADEDTRNGF